MQGKKDSANQREQITNIKALVSRAQSKQAYSGKRHNRCNKNIKTGTLFKKQPCQNRNHNYIESCKKGIFSSSSIITANRLSGISQKKKEARKRPMTDIIPGKQLPFFYKNQRHGYSCYCVTVGYHIKSPDIIKTVFYNNKRKAPDCSRKQQPRTGSY